VEVAVDVAEEVRVALLVEVVEEEGVEVRVTEEVVEELGTLVPEAVWVEVGEEETVLKLVEEREGEELTETVEERVWFPETDADLDVLTVGVLVTERVEFPTEGEGDRLGEAESDTVKGVRLGEGGALQEPPPSNLDPVSL